MLNIKGLVVAPFTAFKEDGALDLERVAAQQQYYKDNNITGVFACGTTGEGSALTSAEKKALLKEWCKYRDDNFAIIAFLGGTSTRECIEVAEYARECGADAVAMTAPYYQKAANVRDLVLTLAEVASKVPDMPFFYYHIPCLTNVNFPMYDLLKLADQMIPNFAGIKYTFENMMDYQLCLNFKDCKYKIMWGRDEMMLEALAIGADTFIGSTYGYNAPIYTEIIKAFEAGDLKKAADLQLEACKIIEYLNKYGNGAGKAFMKAAGFDLGPTRRPFHTLTDSEYSAFVEDLKDCRFEEFKCVVK